MQLLYGPIYLFWLYGSIWQYSIPYTISIYKIIRPSFLSQPHRPPSIFLRKRRLQDRGQSTGNHYKILCGVNQNKKRVVQIQTRELSRANTDFFPGMAPPPLLKKNTKKTRRDMGHVFAHVSVGDNPRLAVSDQHHTIKCCPPNPPPSQNLKTAHVSRSLQIFLGATFFKISKNL